MLQTPTWKKNLIVVVGLLEILVFSGTILGWSSLKLMLKKEGIYGYKCNNWNGQNMSTSIDNSTASPTSMTGAAAAAKSSPVTARFNQKLLPPSANSSNQTLNDHNYQLKINFTFIDDNAAAANNSNRSLLPSPKTIVIPFESREKYNETFIYNLLHNSPIFLKGNTSDAQVGLFNDRIQNNILPNNNNSNSTSTLEDFLHLYLEENVEDTDVSSLFCFVFIMFAILISISIESKLQPIDNDGCKEQEITLNLAFSVGSFCMGAAAFIWGFLLEKWGLRVVRLVIK